ncbi:MAG: phosphohydrolase [Stygiobacter sp. GWC2_38_9]|nr:MAG: phosphohydrolase [Stygiobacter sp. GWC2_38_9]
MEEEIIKRSLDFIRQTERLKNVLRSAHTSNGRKESTAEHTWRLCLMAMVFEKEFKEIDFSRLLKICVIHDLGEAINGDIPAVEQSGKVNKSNQERADLITLLKSLPNEQREYFLSLWDEYENASSQEARLVKGLDKLETIIQHNQGLNPEDFNYEFNLTYGQKHTETFPLLNSIRKIIDEETKLRANKS